MSYSKSLIKEFNVKIPGMGGSDTPASSSGSGGSTASGGGGGGGGMSPAAIMGLIGSGKQIISSLGKEQIGLAGAEAERVASATLQQVPATAAASSKAATQAAIDTAFTRSNLVKAGAAALAGGALLGGGLALGRRIGNIGAKKDKKKLKEAGKKEDLYYKQVDLDPYAPRYTVPQLATTAGGITGTTAGSIYGGKLGSAVGGPIGGFLGAGIGGALGGAAGSIGAYQLAKMARPKKKKKLIQYYR